MKLHNGLPASSWILLPGIVVLLAGHVIFFNRLRHKGLSLTVLSGLALLMIAKHFGVLGSLYAFVRRRLRD